MTDFALAHETARFDTSYLVARSVTRDPLPRVGTQAPQRREAVSLAAVRFSATATSMKTVAAEPLGVRSIPDLKHEIPRPTEALCRQRVALLPRPATIGIGEISDAPRRT